MLISHYNYRSSLIVEIKKSTRSHPNFSSRKLNSFCKNSFRNRLRLLSIVDKDKFNFLDRNATVQGGMKDNAALIAAI
jgi:hypothetical protein